MRPFFVIPFVFALTISAASAQETTSQITPPPAPIVTPEPSDEPEISLETLIQRALENSPRLDIARANIDTATARQSAARALRGPTLQMVPGFTGSRNARDEEIILAQPLDVFGLRRARAQVGAADVRRAEAESRLASRTLIVEVKNAAALLFAAQEAQRLEQVQVEVAQLFRDAAAKRATLGDVPGIQVQRADLELLRAQNNLAQASAMRLNRRASLNFLTGTAPDAPLRVTLPLDATSTALLSGAAAVPQLPSAPSSGTGSSVPEAASAPTTSAGVGGALVTPDAGLVSTRPDIASAEATLEASQAQVRAIRRQMLPSLELQIRRSSFFGYNGSTALRAVVTVPLFDFGAIRGERRAAEADVRAQQATIKLLNQSAATQVENARTQIQIRRETITRYREQILPLALDLLRKTQIGYAQGASTYLEVLEAQRSLRQIQTEYLQALVGAQTAENTLDAALNGGDALVETLNSVARRGVFDANQ